MAGEDLPLKINTEKESNKREAKRDAVQRIPMGSRTCLAASRKSICQHYLNHEWIPRCKKCTLLPKPLLEKHQLKAAIFMHAYTN